MKDSIEGFSLLIPNDSAVPNIYRLPARVAQSVEISSFNERTFIELGETLIRSDTRAWFNLKRLYQPAQRYRYTDLLGLQFKLSIGNDGDLNLVLDRNSVMHQEEQFFVITNACAYDAKVGGASKFVIFRVASNSIEVVKSQVVETKTIEDKLSHIKQKVSNRRNFRKAIYEEVFDTSCSKLIARTLKKLSRNDLFDMLKQEKANIYGLECEDCSPLVTDFWYKHDGLAQSNILNDDYLIAKKIFMKALMASTPDSLDTPSILQLQHFFEMMFLAPRCLTKLEAQDFKAKLINIFQNNFLELTTSQLSYVPLKDGVNKNVRASRFLVIYREVPVRLEKGEISTNPDIELYNMILINAGCTTQYLSQEEMEDLALSRATPQDLFITLTAQLYDHLGIECKEKISRDIDCDHLIIRLRALYDSHKMKNDRSLIERNHKFVLKLSHLRKSYSNGRVSLSRQMQLLNRLITYFEQESAPKIGFNIASFLFDLGRNVIKMSNLEDKDDKLEKLTKFGNSYASHVSPLPIVKASAISDPHAESMTEPPAEVENSSKPKHFARNSNKRSGGARVTPAPRAGRAWQDGVEESKGNENIIGL